MGRMTVSYLSQVYFRSKYDNTKEFAENVLEVISPLCSLEGVIMLSFFTVNEASVIFSNGRDLVIGDIHGRSFHILVHSQNRGLALGVDFHYQEHKVFWTSFMENKVNRNFRSVAWTLNRPSGTKSVDRFSFLGD